VKSRSSGALLRLVRWPGVLTASADAFTAAWLFTGCATPHLFAVCAAAALIYAGGVVLNDVADAGRDRALHPERPLPSGTVSRGAAAVFGSVLIVAGIGVSAVAGMASLMAFTAVAIAVVAYDFALKKVGIGGAIGMGLCRGGSALAAALASPSFRDMVEAVPAQSVKLALPWFLLAVAVTAASLLEESVRRRSLAHWAAAGMAAAPALGAVILATHGDPSTALAVLPWLLFVGALGARVAPIRRDNTPLAMGMLVREGVFGFLLLDATVLAARGHFAMAAGMTALWALLRWVLRTRRS